MSLRLLLALPFLTLTFTLDVNASRMSRIYQPISEALSRPTTILRVGAYAEGFLDESKLIIQPGSISKLIHTAERTCIVSLQGGLLDPENQNLISACKDRLSVKSGINLQKQPLSLEQLNLALCKNILIFLVTEKEAKKHIHLQSLFQSWFLKIKPSYNIVISEISDEAMLALCPDDRSIYPLPFEELPPRLICYHRRLGYSATSRPHEHFNVLYGRSTFERPKTDILVAPSVGDSFELGYCNAFPSFEDYYNAGEPDSFGHSPSVPLRSRLGSCVNGGCGIWVELNPKTARYSYTASTNKEWRFTPVVHNGQETWSVQRFKVEGPFISCTSDKTYYPRPPKNLVLEKD